MDKQSILFKRERQHAEGLLELADHEVQQALADERVAARRLLQHVAGTV